MFSFVDKHLGDAAEGPRKPPERCRVEPCLHSSKPRETGVDNAVSATTDSAHTSFTTSRHATFRGFRHSDASPLLPRQVAGRALTLRPASPNRRNHAPSRAGRSGVRIRRQGALLYCWTWLLPAGTQEGLAPSMPPVGYFRVSDRTTRIEMRSAQRHQARRHPQGRAAASTPEHRLAPHAQVLTQRFSQ